MYISFLISFQLKKNICNKLVYEKSQKAKFLDGFCVNVSNVKAYLLCYRYDERHYAFERYDFFIILIKNFRFDSMFIRMFRFIIKSTSKLQASVPTKRMKLSSIIRGLKESPRITTPRSPFIRLNNYSHRDN